MTTITVRDVVRLALPDGTTVAAGATNLGRQVSWIATLRATLPAFAELRGGELALLSVAAAQALDPRLTLDVLVRRLAQAPVPIAGVVALGTITPSDVQAAEEARLPLLQLPDSADLREVEREIKRLITDYEAQFERRAAQLYDLLTQCSLQGGGIGGLLDLLHERTGQSVACYAPNGVLRAQRGRGQARLALQALRPTARGEITLLNQQIWVEPIGNQNVPTGYVAIAGPTLDRWDQTAVQRGALALALELAKEQAVQAAEERLRGDFIASILVGTSGDLAAAIQRGQELGYTLNMPHTALLVHIDAASVATLGRAAANIQSELKRLNINAPISRRESSVLCMIPTVSIARTRELAEQLRERLLPDHPHLVIAMGTPVAHLSEWRRSLEEAEQALSLGRQLFGNDRVLAFADLGVYRLLIRLRETPELWSFYRETLASLAEYDARQHADLIKTLEAYFNHLGNLRATSEALYIHRNTLLYRLERIKEISGMDLDNAEEYFALWLAIRVHRILATLNDG
ncbi:MAG: CdaR family transcriptional regulator [Chloroflexus sp.]|jgi:purine catabolism regulator|uniref:PucR family transcriptional regulator n=1 Tax=Chloroflexus sp. TaxID=1904827 RepID=UPI0021DC41AF|nr:PucR family transcriptional regulator [Chloroflexus sp.]GIV87606.1 MAG: CdaR family transcriptional regulator [Chloroflexus sp.]